MHADRHLRVALAGDGEAASALREGLATLDGFELAELAGRDHAEPLDVAVLVHEGEAEPRAELAQLREHTGAPVVLATTAPSSGLVRWALDAGIADVLPLPAGRESVLFVIEKAAQTARQAELGGDGRVVTVFSPKGGSGKSVVSTNLAVAAATHAGKQTLLIDLDLQFGDAAIMLGLAPDNTVRELLGTPTALDGEKLDVYTERHSSGVDVLPAPMSPEDAELVGEEAIRALLQVAREAYDLVVVDTAPFFYGPMLATLDQTDQLLLLCNPDVPTLKNVRLTLKTLELLSFPGRSAAHRAQPRECESDGPRRRRSGARPQGGLGTAARPVGAARGERGDAAVLAAPDAPFGVAMLELARATAGGDWAAKQQHTGQRDSSALGGAEHVSAATDQRHGRLRRPGSPAASHRQLRTIARSTASPSCARRFTTSVSRRSGPSSRR